MLAVAFAAVDFEFYVGDGAELAVLFYVRAEVASFALEKDECVCLAGVGDGGKENSGALAIW